MQDNDFLCALEQGKRGVHGSYRLRGAVPGDSDNGGHDSLDILVRNNNAWHVGAKHYAPYGRHRAP